MKSNIFTHAKLFIQLYLCLARAALSKYSTPCNPFFEKALHMQRWGNPISLHRSRDTLKKHCIGAEPYLIASCKAASQKQTAKLPLTWPIFLRKYNCYFEISCLFFSKKAMDIIMDQIIAIWKNVIHAQVHQEDFKSAWS